MDFMGKADREMYERYIPEYKAAEILADADREDSSRYFPLKYLAFPSILDLDERRMLICYRRGERHAWSKGVIEGIVYDKEKKRILSRSVLDDTENGNDQNVEVVRMPDGDIVCYIDVQAVSDKVVRLGIKQLRSSDGGVTWQTIHRLTDDTGIEYGYVYDSLIVDGDIYMLALTYPELEDQGTGRFVHVIKSQDSGRTWRHVRNLKDAFGYSCDDECCFAAYKCGFLVVVRGRDRVARAFVTDGEFRVIAERNLTADFSCVDHLCRPSLFVEEGNYYLMGRNAHRDGSMELALYRFEPGELRPVFCVQLDAAGSGSELDGFYAESYLQDIDGVKYFNVITYSEAYSDHPDILRLEYLWDEVRQAKIASRQ